MHNNSPDDVNFWLLEPKNELQPYRDLAHTALFADQQDDAFYETSVAALEGAVAEMQQRCAAFLSHPKQPETLTAARSLAQSDPTGAGHLRYPYVFIVFEECSFFFSKPHKEHRAEHQRLLEAAEMLADGASAAGIYLVLVTQYPTKENIHPSLKQRCRRVGLPVTSVMASYVILDMPGLERFRSPGRGYLSERDKLTEYKALHLTTHSGQQGRRQDDRANILSALRDRHNSPCR